MPRWLFRLLLGIATIAAIHYFRAAICFLHADADIDYARLREIFADYAHAVFAAIDAEVRHISMKLPTLILRQLSWLAMPCRYAAAITLNPVLSLMPAMMPLLLR